MCFKGAARLNMVSFSNTETSAVQKFIKNEAKEFLAYSQGC